MTLLNTITNLGGNWPSTVALALVDPLTTRACLLSGGTDVGTDGTIVSSQKEVDGLQNCNTNASDTAPAFQAQACVEAAGHCVATTDGTRMNHTRTLGALKLSTTAVGAGYYTLSAFCFMFGVWWIYYFTPEMAALEELPTSGDDSAWRVQTASGSTGANKTAIKKG